MDWSYNRISSYGINTISEKRRRNEKNTRKHSDEYRCSSKVFNCKERSKNNKVVARCRAAMKKNRRKSRINARNTMKNTNVKNNKK